jgi:Sigma-70 region 2
MTHNDPDLGFVQALKSGQDQALNALMDRHRKGIFHFVLRCIPNEADALELTAEVFVRAYFRIERFEPTARFVTWLYEKLRVPRLTSDGVSGCTCRGRRRTKPVLGG